MIDLDAIFGHGPNALLAWLLTYLIHSSILILGVALILRVTRQDAYARRDALLRCALLFPVLSATLQTTLGTVPVVEPDASMPALQAEAAAPHTSRVAAVPASTASDSACHATELSADFPTEPFPTYSGPLHEAPATLLIQDDFIPVESEESEAPAAEIIPTEKPSAGPGVGWLLRIALFSTWASCALLLLMRFLGRRVGLRVRMGQRQRVEDGILRARLDRLAADAGIKRRIRLTVCDQLPSPVCLGRREICVPTRALEDLSEDQQTAMLAHEVAHLRRGDPSWLFFAGLLENLLFVQPFNRRTRLAYQSAAEFLCDEWASRRHAESGLSLATCLAEVAGWMRPERASKAASVLPGMAHDTSDLLRRVERLLNDPTAPARSIPRPIKVACGAGLLAAITAFAPGVSTDALAGPKSAALYAEEHFEAVRMQLTTPSHSFVITSFPMANPVAVLDGVALPDSCMQREGDLLALRDQQGALLIHLRLLPEGGFAWDIPNNGAGGRLENAEAITLELGLRAPEASLLIEHGVVRRADAHDPGADVEQEADRVRVAQGGRPVLILHQAADGGHGEGGFSAASFIGLAVSPVSDALAAQLGVSIDSVSLVTSADAELPAARAGLRRYDVITGVDGSDRAGPTDIGAALAGKRPGALLRLRVLRVGRPLAITVPLPGLLIEGSGPIAYWRDLAERLSEGRRGADEAIREQLVLRARSELDRSIAAGIKQTHAASLARAEKSHQRIIDQCRDFIARLRTRVQRTLSGVELPASVDANARDACRNELTLGLAALQQDMLRHKQQLLEHVFEVLEKRGANASVRKLRAAGKFEKWQASLAEFVDRIERQTLAGLTASIQQLERHFNDDLARFHEHLSKECANPGLAPDAVRRIIGHRLRELGQSFKRVELEFERG